MSAIRYKYITVSRGLSAKLLNSTQPFYVLRMMSSDFSGKPSFTANEYYPLHYENHLLDEMGMKYFMAMCTFKSLVHCVYFS